MPSRPTLTQPDRKTPFHHWLQILWKPVLLLGSFEIYLRTLNPVFPNDDSAETITAGATLGLQHPPGYALAAIFGRLFSLLPLGNPCFRVNVGSALLASFSVVLLAGMIHFTLKSFWENNSEGESLLLFCAAWGSLLLAFSPAFWRNALGAKGGIYLLGVVLQLALTSCLLSQVIPALSVNRRWIFLSFFIFGLGFANHWETQMVFLPAFLLFFFLPNGENSKIHWASPLLKSLSLFLLALSPLLYLPLRAQAHPVLNLGAPGTFSLFIADLSRSYLSFRETSLGELLAQVLKGTSTWDQFADLWRLILKVQGRPISDHLLNNTGLLPLILSILGLLAWLGLKERKLLLFLFLSFAGLLMALLTALRISDNPHSTWMLDNFLIPADWILALLASVGMFFLLSRLRHSPSKVAPLVILLLGAIPFLMAFKGFDQWSQEKQTLPYDYGENLLKSIPRNSVFFAEADEDYFSLYYLQNVARQRPDIRMIPTFTLFETWGVEQTERLFPDLGLTASSMVFPDHFDRVIYATSEIAVKNRDKIPITFSYFDGAFHRFYLSRNPSFLLRKSGNILELTGPTFVEGPVLALGNLRLRHASDDPSNHHPSLFGIWDIYKSLGF